MQPFDDLSPAELNPQNEEILAFLRQSHGIRESAPEPEPQEKAQSVALVRQRFQQVLRTPVAEESEQPAVLYLVSTADPFQDMAPASKSKKKPARRRWKRGMALLAAALCAMLLVGSLLTLIQRQARLAAAPGTPALYLVTPGWLQKVNARTGEAIWQAQLPYERPHAVTPIDSSLVSSGAVYVIDMDILSAFNSTTGAQLWSVKVPTAGHGDSGELFQSTPPDGHLYYKSTLGGIYAFDASSGHQLWRYQNNTHNNVQIDGYVDDIVVTNNVLYAAVDNMDENKLLALDTRSGKLKWSVTTNAGLNARSTQVYGLVHHENELVVQNGTVYQILTPASQGFPATGDYLYAWRADTGAPLWHSQNFLPASFAQHRDLFYLTSNLIAAGDALYVDTTAGLFAFGANDGGLHWMQPEGGALPEQILRKEQVPPNWQKLEIGGSGSPESSFFVEGNTIWYMEMTDQGNFIARLDAGTGKVLGRQRVENFCCTQEEAWLPSGSQQATGITVIRQFQGLVTGTISYVFSSGDHLDALDNQTGARLWSLQLPEVGPTVLLEGPW